MCHDCASEDLPTLTQQFASRLLECSRALLPEPARRNAAVLLADFLACLRAGAGQPGCPAASWEDFAKVLLAGDARAGRAGVTDASAAAAAAAAHALDRDDIHWDAVTHPGSVVWPVVLGLGAEVGATGPQLLAAAVTGYEACVRMAAFLGPQHRRWFHSTSTSGTIGAAAAAAMLLCPDDGALTNALGHAISVIGGSARCLGEHSGTQVFHRSHAVRSGIAAARAAADGLSATRLGFEGTGGLLAGPEPAERARAALIDDRPAAIGTTSVRLYATAGWNQAAAEAAAAQPRSALRDSPELAVHVHPTAADVGSGPAACGRDRWWSLEWSVATTLVTGDPQVSPDAPVKDEALRERLALAMVVVGDQPSPLSASVWLTAAGRPASTTSVSCPAGHYARPASAEQLAAKWSTMNQANGWAAATVLESFCADALATAGRASGRLGALLVDVGALLVDGGHADQVSSSATREGWSS
jgi:2-methylcitrate dehydratase PrpD